MAEADSVGDFFRFFHGPNLRTLGLTAAMHARAAAIRASHTYPVVPPSPPKRYSLADALHLAAAIESGCDVFLSKPVQPSDLVLAVQGLLRTGAQM